MANASGGWESVLDRLTGWVRIQSSDGVIEKQCQFISNLREKAAIRGDRRRARYLSVIFTHSTRFQPSLGGGARAHTIDWGEKADFYCPCAILLTVKAWRGWRWAVEKWSPCFSPIQLTGVAPGELSAAGRGGWVRGGGAAGDVGERLFRFLCAVGDSGRWYVPRIMALHMRCHVCTSLPYVHRAAMCAHMAAMWTYGNTRTVCFWFCAPGGSQAS
jgi:hypothetical protein